MIKIGIVAVEPSADILGAGLIQAISKQKSDVEFIGVGGPRMAALGLNSLYPFHELSHMGLTEVIKHLPTLLRARRFILSQMLENKIDLFIGIDAPDFNLYLEERLKKHNISTVHYVSPSVWAWRKRRIHRIKRAVDLVLTLFPFENAIYDEHKISVQFVGHPLADDIPLQCDGVAARRALSVAEDKKVIGLFPGSRASEIHYMAELFVEAAKLCYQYNHDFLFLIALPNELLKQQLLACCGQLLQALPVQIVIGNSGEVLAAADVVLVKSGTVTLQALLYKKPMVVSYKTSVISAWIVRCLIHVPYISLPNLLANKRLVPEILQNEITPQKLADALLAYFMHPERGETLKKEYEAIHRQLRLNASETAARAVLKLIQ